MAEQGIKEIKIDNTQYLIEPTIYTAVNQTSASATFTAALANFQLFDGALVAVKFKATNNANATLNINSTGAKPIYYNNAKITANQLKANHTYTLSYVQTLNSNNGGWELIGDLDTNTQSDYGNITTSGKIGTTADLAVYTTTSGLLTAGSLSVTDDTTIGDTATTFVAKVTQNGIGKITVTKAALPTASTDTAGITTVGASGGAAAYNHNHDINNLTNASSYLKWQTTTAESTALYDFGVYVNMNHANGSSMTGSNYFNILNIPYRKASGNAKADWGWQLGNITENDGRLWYRTIGNDEWGDWQTIAHATQSANDIGSATQPVYMTAAGVITAGTALGAAAYKEIINNTSAGALGWNNAGNTHADNLRLVNVNTLAYWDGTYRGTSSNLTYYKGGAFGTMAKETATDYAKLASPTFTGTPKAPTAANGTSTTQIATTEFVNNTLAYANAMTFKGTLGTDGTVTALPATHNAGDTYRVITADTWAGKYCEVGTLIICVTDGTSADDAHWTSVETNEDGAVIGTTPTSSTDNAIVRWDGNSGRIIQDSGVTIDDDGRIFWTHTSGKSTSGMHFKYSNTIDYWWGVGSGDSNHGLYDQKKGSNGTWIIYADTNNNWSFTGNAATATSAASATTLSGTTPTLAATTESNEITVKDLGNTAPESGKAQRKGIDFRWYDSHWMIGNLRSGSTPSAGFGFSYSSDSGSTYSNLVIIDTNGNINASGGFTGTLIGNASTATYIQGIDQGTNNIDVAATITNPGEGKIRYDYRIGQGSTGLFSCASGTNTNAILTLSTATSASYGHQLGFSSNGHLYHRTFVSEAFSNTKTWDEILDSVNYSSYALPVSGGTLGKSNTIDNTAFKNILILYSNQSNESSTTSFDATKSSWGIGFQRKWNNGTEGAATHAGIYAYGISEWRTGLVFRTKTGNSSSATHDVSALILNHNADAAFSGNISLSDATKSIVRDGSSINWNQASTRAMIRMVTKAGWSPLFSLKADTGWWNMGHYNSSGFNNHLLFTFLNDNDVSGVSGAQNHMDYTVRLIPVVHTDSGTTDRAFVTAPWANSKAAVGNSTQPIYIDDNGVATACATTTVSNAWSVASNDTTKKIPMISTTVNGVTGTAVAIPEASTSAGGIVTIGTQSFSGSKTFIGDTFEIRADVIRLRNKSNNNNAVTNQPYVTSLVIGDSRYINFTEYKDDHLVINSKSILLDTTSNGITAYDPSKTYSLNAIVWYDRSYYYCSTAITEAEAWNSAHWTAMPASNIMANASFVPWKNNSYALGSSSYRWSKVYIGTADSYGNDTTPIYWNNGVPKACTSYANASVNYATSAGSASSATTATYSTYPKIVASNEIRFDVNTKPSSATDLYIGYAWSDGSKDAKINGYRFENGNSNLAKVYASEFVGSLNGNASTASKITNLTTTDMASSSDVWRRVWFCYSDNATGRPAYKDTIAFQTSTDTLKSGKYLVGDHVKLEYNTIDDSLDFIFI